MVRSFLTIILATSFCLSARPATKPNIIFVLVDDMGWSDLGCYGSEIRTPHIDSLAESGIRFTQFYNTAKCNTSRACLLTGLYAQQCGMMSPGNMHPGVTLGEVLQTSGYRTYASGKHHGTENLRDRGFDRYYGLRDGCCNFWNPGKQRPGEPAPGRKKQVRFWCDDEGVTHHPFTPENRDFYTTDAFTDRALSWLDEKELTQQPFLLFLAYTAPHYPLHAWPEDIAKYKGTYDEGYLAIRQARYEKMSRMGLIDPKKSPLPAWDGPEWEKLSDDERAREIRRMEIYAAMLDHVDQNLGRVIAKLKKQGKWENTLVFFASDNGACAEATGAFIQSDRLEDFGTVASYETVGKSWATVQNTPLRKWKNYSHEGGIRTPLIVSWPGKISSPGSFCDQPGHLIDIMPTLVEITGSDDPSSDTVPAMAGISLAPTFVGGKLTRDRPIFWQWSQGGAVRQDDFKAVFWGNGKDWELYDLGHDTNETHNLAAAQPEKLQSLKDSWHEWMASVTGRNR